MRRLKLFAAAAAACIGCALAAPAVNAATFTALSTDDAQLYGAAFQAAEKGDRTTIQDLLARVSDPCLAGYVELKRLMAPQVTASFEDLTQWLDRNAELPGAERVAKLAEKRAPKNSGWRISLPFFPQAAVYASAREAFYSGDPKTAYALAIATREPWIAGLSAFRLKDYPEARKHFEQVARDGEEDEWIRAAGAYWAARTAIIQGRPEEAPAQLRLAARWPQTFYGMIAESQLGLEPGAGATVVRGVEAERPYQVVRAAYSSALNPQAQALIAGDARAKRAAALIQVGQTEAAAQELRRALVAASTDAERQGWIALAIELNTEGQAARAARPRYREFSYEDFPTPDLQPQGGFTIDKALVYALIKQESRFNPEVRSHAGAIGLMQIKASTAAEAMGDDSLKRGGSALYNPAINLRAGQDYIDVLLRKWTDGDMIRAVAAYNGGPGSVLKAHRYAGAQDSLMVVETLPAAQTREYVEKVMTNYWTYRRLFGQKTRSIDAIASGVNTVDVRLDR